jgi:hypothetical protein
MKIDPSIIARYDAEKTWFENLKRYNIKAKGIKKSIFGGVKPKALFIGNYQCNHCHWATDQHGNEYLLDDCQLEFVDVVTKLPHVPTCPRGHKQGTWDIEKGEFNEFIIHEKDEWFDQTYSIMTKEDAMLYGLYHAMADPGDRIVRGSFSRDGILTPEEFFSTWGKDKFGNKVKIKD